MRRSNALQAPPRSDGELLPRPEKLWGLPAIAQALAVSVATARRWANDPAIGLPVYRPVPGKYFALRPELMDWLKRR